MEDPSRQEFRPRLVPCRILTYGSKVVVESTDHLHQSLFPLRRRRLLEMLDGRHTIHEIVSKLFTLEGRVSFKAVYSTLQVLSEAGLLVTPPGEHVDFERHRSPFESSLSPLLKPLREKPLFSRLYFGFRSLPLYYLLAMAVIAAVFLLPDGLVRAGLGGGGLIERGRSFALLLPVLAVSLSLLLSLKNLLKVLLLGLATGYADDIRLRLNWHSLQISTSDTPILSLDSRLAFVLYTVACALAYLFFSTLFAQLWPGSPYVNDVRLLSIILTLLSLDPYRRSEVTKLFDAFYSEEHMIRVLPYLRNRSLLSFLSPRTEVEDHGHYLFYSLVAFAWTLAFGSFLITVLQTNLPDALTLLKQGTAFDKAATLLLLLPICVLLLYVLLGCVQILFNNLLNPILSPLYRFAENLKAPVQGTPNPEELFIILKRLPLFQDTREESLLPLIGRSSVRRYRPGTRIITQDSPGLELFVVLKGSVDVLKRDRTGLQTKLARLSEGAVFGEIALIRECLRTADVVAVDEVECLLVTKQSFDLVLHDQSIGSDYQKIFDRIALGHYISSSQLFKNVPLETIQVFTTRGTMEHVAAGLAVTRQGDLDKSFYLLLRGAVRVVRDGKKVADLKQGDFFGEIGLISNLPRTATIESTADCLFLKLDSHVFWDVLRNNPALALQIEAVAEQRLDKAE